MNSLAYQSNFMNAYFTGQEGAARNSKKELIQFVYISLSSLSEIETQLIISERLGYFKVNRVNEHIEKFRKKTLNFIKYLKTKAKD